MKCAFQLVKRSDGNRSDIFLLERSEFADVLLKKFSEPDCEDMDDFYVLVLVEFPSRVDDSAEWDFSNAPLLGVRYFIELFRTSAAM